MTRAISGHSLELFPLDSTLTGPHSSRLIQAEKELEEVGTTVEGCGETAISHHSAAAGDAGVQSPLTPTSDAAGGDGDVMSHVSHNESWRREFSSDSTNNGMLTSYPSPSIQRRLGVQKYRLVSREEWMDGWVDGWMDGWMDGWFVDGWVDGWMDGMVCVLLLLGIPSIQDEVEMAVIVIMLLLLLFLFLLLLLLLLYFKILKNK